MSLNHLSRYARAGLFSELATPAKKANTWKLIFQSRAIAADVANADRHSVVERALEKLPPAHACRWCSFIWRIFATKRLPRTERFSGQVKTIFFGRQALQKMLRSQLATNESCIVNEDRMLPDDKTLELK